MTKKGLMKIPWLRDIIEKGEVEAAHAKQIENYDKVFMASRSRRLDSQQKEILYKVHQNKRLTKEEEEAYNFINEQYKQKRRDLSEEQLELINNTKSIGDFAKASRKVQEVKNQKEIKDKTLIKDVVESGTAKDFVWRNNAKRAIKFSPEDTIIGAKNGLSLKEGKDIHLGIQELQTIMGETNNNILRLTQVTRDTLKNIGGYTVNSIQPIPSQINVREPAYDNIYNFRTRMWKKLGMGI